MRPGRDHMEAAAYLRVSSVAQDFPSQKHAVERAAQARGDVVSHWYSEKRSAKTTTNCGGTYLHQDGVEVWQRTGPSTGPHFRCIPRLESRSHQGA